MTRAALVARLAEQYNLDEEQELLLADGFEAACLGISRSFNTHKVCYDYERCIQILVERDGMDREEAEEFFEFNVVGAYVGEGTPAFLTLLDPPISAPAPASPPVAAAPESPKVV